MLLRIKKPAGNRVVQQGFAIPLEVGNFGFGQLDALALFVVEVFSRFADPDILRAGLVIDEKALNSESGVLEIGFGEDRPAEIFQLVLDVGIQGGHEGRGVEMTLIVLIGPPDTTTGFRAPQPPCRGAAGASLPCDTAVGGPLRCCDSA